METRLIVPLLSAESAATDAAAARDAGAALVELRVDQIGDARIVESLLATAPGTWIVTIRSAEEGGFWDAGEDERISLFERLGLAQPGWIDVEFATWRRSANIRQKIALVASADDAMASDRSRNRLILSSHDLRSTPSDADLDDLLSAIRVAGPSVAKIVTTARDSRDALRILSLLSRNAGKGPLIALAMGEAGQVTRVLGPKFGAWGNFASLRSGAESAPGQLTIDDLRSRFRYESIGPATRVFGVTGWPVAHSRSPLIHNAAMTADNIDGVYLPIPIIPDRGAFFEFMDRVAAEPALGFAGFSVTIPHKESALAWLESRGAPVSPLAARCRAVNTLISDGDGWRGENTDGFGATAAIRATIGTATAVPTLALILGAGGAARAVAAALMDLGMHVRIANRTSERARELATELGCEFIDWSKRADAAVDLIVNCTSVGMWPETASSPFPAAALRRGCVVFDTIYNPADTRLLLDARNAGCVTISGVEMFLAQAGAQYALWHSRPAPMQVMRTAFSTTGP